jgi:hypothetical protein
LGRAKGHARTAARALKARSTRYTHLLAQRGRVDLGVGPEQHAERGGGKVLVHQKLEQDVLVDVGREAADAERAGERGAAGLGVVGAQRAAQRAEQRAHRALHPLHAAEDLERVGRRVEERLVAERAEHGRGGLERVRDGLGVLGAQLRDAAREQVAEQRLVRAEHLVLGHGENALPQPEPVHFEQKEHAPHVLGRREVGGAALGARREHALVDRDHLLADVAPIPELPGAAHARRRRHGRFRCPAL